MENDCGRLLTVLECVPLSRMSPRLGVRKHWRHAMGESRTVLLVEDEPDFRDAVVFVLRRHGYAVTPAATVAEAVSRLACGLPDLLLVDMILPGESGFQILRLVKERSDGRVPAIMMSGYASVAHQDYALAAGVELFLPKPFKVAQLLDAADSLCPLLHPTPLRPVTPTVAACS
jgi:two-component system OmpR family response regulator